MIFEILQELNLATLVRLVKLEEFILTLCLLKVLSEDLISEYLTKHLR